MQVGALPPVPIPGAVFILAASPRRTRTKPKGLKADRESFSLKQSTLARDDQHESTWLLSFIQLSEEQAAWKRSRHLRNWWGTFRLHLSGEVVTLLPFTAAGRRGLVRELKPAGIINSLWPAVARAAPAGEWWGSLGAVSSSLPRSVGSPWLRCATVVVSLAEVSGSAAGTTSLLLRGFLKLGEPQEQPGACNSQASGWWELRRPRSEGQLRQSVGIVPCLPWDRQGPQQAWQRGFPVLPLPAWTRRLKGGGQWHCNWAIINYFQAGLWRNYIRRRMPDSAHPPKEGVMAHTAHSELNTSFQTLLLLTGVEHTCSGWCYHTWVSPGPPQLHREMGLKKSYHSKEKQGMKTWRHCRKRDEQKMSVATKAGHKKVLGARCFS